METLEEQVLDAVNNVVAARMTKYLETWAAAETELLEQMPGGEMYKAILHCRKQEFYNQMAKTIVQSCEVYQVPAYLLDIQVPQDPTQIRYLVWRANLALSREL